MTPRERVMTAFAHEEPDRVPRWCGASPEFIAKAKQYLGIDDTEQLSVRFGDDFRRVYARYVGPEPDLAADAMMQTVFGIDRRGLGYGQPMAHPLADATVDEIDAYPWPDPGWWDVSGIRDAALAWGGQYAILGGDWSPFWHDAIDLLGMETLMLRMCDAPEIVDALLDHIVSYYHEASRRILDAAADAIDIFFIGNDFGSQTGPLVGPRLFERFLLPHLARLIDLGHSYRLKVQLHCCGGVEPLLSMMIGAGLDGIHAVQPGCRGMDLAHLKSTYGDRILFNGAIDSQAALIEGTPDLVRERTREVISIMAPGGGYVAGASHDYILEETPVENVLAVFDAVAEFGTYPALGRG